MDELKTVQSVSDLHRAKIRLGQFKAVYSISTGVLFLHRYKISLLKPSVKALALSTRVSIRTDDRGFLSIQYMIKNDDGQVCFVEYYVSD